MIKSAIYEREAEVISSKLAEVKRLWPELSEEERRKKLYELHRMLAVSSELIQEAVLSDIVPDLETEAEYRAELMAAKERLAKNGILPPGNGGPTNGRDSLDKWPIPVAQEAYYGLAGDVVRTISPHSEADDVALLVNFLVAFGNVIGPGPHFIAGADKHFTNLFAVLVGETSKGRKGMSWNRIRELFSRIDGQWAAYKTPDGLSSGEGLIWAVRDQIMKENPIKKEGWVVDYQEVIEDAGVSDKRLLIVEGEFASILKVMQRDGNTLSPVIRGAWDKGILQSLTKNSPAKATDVHISILGHISREELLRNLTSTEMGNGFGNRFLWVCVRRSKSLPDGGIVPEEKIKALVDRIKDAVSKIQGIGFVTRDKEANEIWHAVYSSLSEGKPGLYGALIARAEAQAMRLACIYALLDSSAIVRAEHLRGALAIWEYCEESAHYIFGDRTGNPVADKIMFALYNGPLSQTALHGLFKRHVKGEAIGDALELLLRLGKVECEEKETGGRPTIIWHLKQV